MPLARALIDQMIIDVGPEVFRQLATLYQQETRQAVQDVRRLAEAPAERVDWREIGRRAHSLKHAALSFGLNELAALAYRIEQAADAGDGETVTRETSVLQAISEPNLAELAALVIDMRFK
jgi:HPt (histidine-containing phosphotransfer) domain-containing protein